MKDELRQWLLEIAAHPITYGLGAAIARWALGDGATGERATVGDKCRCEAPYRIDEGRTTYCALDARVPFAFTVDAFSVSVCREVK